MNSFSFFKKSVSLVCAIVLLLSSISCVFVLNAETVDNPTVFDFSSSEQVLCTTGENAGIVDGALKLNVPWGNNVSRAKLNYELELNKTYKVSFDVSVSYLEEGANKYTVFTLNTASASSTDSHMFYSNYVSAANSPTGAATYDAHEKSTYSPNTILYNMSASNSTTKSHYEFEFTVDYLPEDHKYLGILFQSSYKSTYILIDNFVITDLSGGGNVEFVSGIDGSTFDTVTGYYGQEVTFPEAPFGYKVNGWYLDSELTVPAENVTVPLENNTVTVYADLVKDNPQTFDFSSSEQVLALSGEGTAITDGALKLNVPWGGNSSKAKLNYALELNKTYKVSFDASVSYPEGNGGAATVFTLNTASAERADWYMLYSNYVSKDDSPTGVATWDAHERIDYTSNTVLYNMSATAATTKSHYEFEFTVDYLPEDHKYLGILFQSSYKNTYILIDNFVITEMNGGTVNFVADVEGVEYDSITGYDGQVVDFPEAPLGYKINAWYSDEEHTLAAEKAIIPAKDESITYYAECEMLPATEEIPNAPVILSVKNNTVTLAETEGCEYSCDGEVWQSSPIFVGLFDGIEYNFCQRIAATTEYSAGNAGQAVAYTIVRPSDIDGNGKINSVDLVSVRNYLLGKTAVVYEDACGGSIDARDIVKLKKVLAAAAGKTDANLEKVPAAGEYSFCTEDDIDGYITVTDIADYLCGNMGTMKTSSGVEGWSTKEVFTETFTFVPKGTVLTADTQFKVYCYNGVFTSTDEISEYVNSYTISRDSYIKWTIKSNSDLANSAQDELNTVAANLTIKVPKSRINDFYVFDKFDSAAYAYAIEEVELLKNFAEIKTENAVNYIFITDLHEGSNNDAVKRQLEEIVTIANNPDNDIDFVCLGGDISTGMRSTKESYKNTLDGMLKPLNECKVPVLILKGNHDDNSYYYWFSYDKSGKTDDELAQAVADTVITDADWYEFMLGTYANDDNSAEEKTSSRVHDTQNTDSAYYYLDLTEKKTRIICLNASDYGDPTTSVGGPNWYGYGERQLEWLATEALNAGDEWNYMFLSHMGYDYDIQKNSTIYHNLDVLEGIMTAFQNKTTYGDYDFSTSTGKILSYQFGHTHFDIRYYDEALNIATMNIGTSGQYSVGVEKDVSLGGIEGIELFRRPYTETEALFDLVSATSDKVYELRFGAGENVEYPLR